MTTNIPMIITDNIVGHRQFIGVFSTRTPQFIVSDPKMIKHITITDFKSFGQNEFSKLVSDNFLVARSL